METYVFPWAMEGMDFGNCILELGPGYGISTNLLLSKCSHLTCIESDPDLASRLEQRLRLVDATVLQGNASSMQLPGTQFDTAVCFMMLHHVTPAPAQDRLFSEVLRVLKPGGIFAGADSPQGLLLRILHISDTVCMVDPGLLAIRLRAAGFEDIQVANGRHAFRFRARKPMGSIQFRDSAANARYEDVEQYAEPVPAI